MPPGLLAASAPCGVPKTTRSNTFIMKDNTQAFPTSETSEASSSPPTPTSSPYRSPALASLRLAVAEDLKARIAASGLRPKGLLGRFDPSTLSLKTAQLCLFEDSGEYLRALPSMVMMRKGCIYKATGLAFSSVVGDYILLPTPIASDWKASNGRHRFFGTLKKGWGQSLPSYIRDGESDGIYPNPELTEVLMSFPAGYTDCAAPETLSCHSSECTSSNASNATTPLP